MRDMRSFAQWRKDLHHIAAGRDRTYGKTTAYDFAEGSYVGLDRAFAEGPVYPSLKLNTSSETRRADRADVHRLR